MKFSENLGTDASKWDCHTSSVWVTLGFGSCLFIRLIHHKSHRHLSENLFEETFIDQSGQRERFLFIKCIHHFSYMSMEIRVC